MNLAKIISFTFFISYFISLQHYNLLHHYFIYNLIKCLFITVTCMIFYVFIFLFFIFCSLLYLVREPLVCRFLCLWKHRFISNLFNGIPFSFNFITYLFRYILIDASILICSVLPLHIYQYFRLFIDKRQDKLFSLRTCLNGLLINSVCIVIYDVKRCVYMLIDT